jgi:hypothetical protein
MSAAKIEDSMRGTTRLLGVVAMLAMLTMFMLGCGSIRVIREAKGGGTVALEGSHDGARAKAERYMSSQCTGGWDIIEEGDATSSDGESREWRITYVCAGSSAPRTASVGF